MGHIGDIKHFKSVVKGRNFFTPNINCYYKTNKGVIELSESGQLYRYINNSDIYGVTVVEKGVYMKNKSNVFNSLKEAKEYIKNNFNVTKKHWYQRYNAYGDTKLETIIY